MVVNSIIGPHTTIAANASVRDSIIRDSIINQRAMVQSAALSGSLVGDAAVVYGEFRTLNVGDASEIR